MRTDESGNEDIFNEAVSLVQRVEIECSSIDELVVLGCNSSGWLFVYLGSDPAYRFDSKGRLRRAFVDGFLYRSNGATLTRLERDHQRNTAVPFKQSASILYARDLTVDELGLFRRRTRDDLARIANDIQTARLVRQYPANEADLRSRFLAGMQFVLGSNEFLAPAIAPR